MKKNIKIMYIKTYCNQIVFVILKTSMIDKSIWVKKEIDFAKKK